MKIWPEIECTGQRVGYARVSTKDQKLRVQRDWLKSMHCEKIFSDHGVSGKKANRPGLDEMMDYLVPGDAVIVWKLDRLGRSVSHLANLLNRFDEEGVHFCSVTEGINTTTPGGKLVFHIFAAVAEFQRDIIVENTHAGIQAARDAGKHVGRPPKISVEMAINAHQQIKLNGVGKDEIAASLKVSRVTLDRALSRYIPDLQV